VAKKSEEELESNILNDLYHGIAEMLPERKQRKSTKDEVEVMDAESKLLEDKKRARYEAIKAKYRE
jgi:hypothetical protein